MGFLQLRFGRRFIPEERKLSREAAVSLIMQGLFIFGSTMSGTFMNLYLWRLTNSIGVNGMFNAILYAFTALGFIVGGKMVKRKGVMPIYRVGVALIALYYLGVVLAREKMVLLFPLFAVFLGLAGGLYWIGYWSLTYVVSNEANRLRFIGLSSVMSTVAALAAPLVSAAVFSFSEGLRGYVIVFSIAFLLFLCTAVLSFRIQVPGVRRKTYYLAHMIPLVRKNAAWRNAVVGNILFGFKQGALIFLPTILVYQVLQEENRVGYLNAALSLLSITVSYLFSRYASAQGTRIYLLVTVTLYSVGALMLVSGVSVWTVLVFMVFHSVCGPVKAGTYDGYFYRLIGTLPMKGELRVETMVIREVCWNIGRISFVVLLIAFVRDLEAAWLPWLVLLAMASQYALVLLMERSEPARAR